MGVRLSPAPVGWFAAGLVHVLARTVRVVRDYEDRRYEVQRPSKERAIYAFWHGRLLLAALAHLESGIAIPVSRHRDGEYVARMAVHIGARPVRGSTRRGGAQALLGLVRAARETDLAVTPDGPRGPRYVVQPGIIHLARLSGRPIVPGALEAAPAWTANSWDEFTLPCPFGRLVVCGGPPIVAPPDLDEAGTETLRRRLEAEMHRLTAKARRILQRGAEGVPHLAAHGAPHGVHPTARWRGPASSPPA